MSTIKKVSFFGRFLVCVYCGKSPFSGKFSVWDNMSFCLRIYMSTTIKLLSLADFEFVSLCLQPKSSFLWQIANLCQHVYNKKNSFSGRFSVCVYVSACLQGNVSLLWQIMSLYLHVYNQQVPSSGRFWVCVYVSACLQPKSSLPWHIFSLSQPAHNGALHVFGTSLMIQTYIFSVFLYCSQVARKVIIPLRITTK